MDVAATPPRRLEEEEFKRRKSGSLPVLTAPVVNLSGWSNGGSKLDSTLLISSNGSLAPRNGKLASSLLPMFSPEIEQDNGPHEGGQVESKNGVIVNHGLPTAGGQPGAAGGGESEGDKNVLPNDTMIEREAIVVKIESNIAAPLKDGLDSIKTLASTSEEELVESEKENKVVAKNGIPESSAKEQTKDEPVRVCLNGILKSSGKGEKPKRRVKRVVHHVVFKDDAKKEETKVMEDGESRAACENCAEDEANEDEDEDEDDEEEETYRIPENDSNDYTIDHRDEGTADGWVKRHPELVRLTGRHPFNSEPPLTRLVQHGFITPTSLHYVRNHGYVPNAEFDDWKVEVSGLVKRPLDLSMHQIMHEFKARELPVTLVCAGNRRKEQNMVQQTIGFNWGAAAISTSVWRGARLYDILRRCGVYSKKKGALFVCFEGAETLPGGGGSKYGTSISIDVALDESRDILVAYMQNGKPLEPDHGFPVRLIIPGYIGGRMVKWLKRITVTSQESDNHYHYRDNRVLPSHVDAEKANAEGWWYKPEYIINDLNINSAISNPAHGEVLVINASSLLVPYNLKGYAYSGGGRKVIRVEVTINGGETWMLCKLNHPEKPTKYGKYWCWCFWELEIEVLHLIQAKELAVRAWDASMNTQPEKLTWNVMGMMNNCWFRVKISPCSQKGGLGLTFEHPTRPGNQGGGWMVKSSAQNAEQQDKVSFLSKSFSSPMLNHSARQITNAELKRHNTRESAWIAIHHNVYDCTKFLKDHPGGSDSILINAGSDCTEEFDAIHSAKAKAMLEDFKIGELASYGSMSSAESTPDNSMHGGNRAFSELQSLFPISESSPARPAALNPRQKIKCKLISKQILSHDVRLFRFELPSKEQILGLPVGKHIFLSATIGGKLCMRAYTPVSSDEDVGYFELLIKVYFKDVHPKFPAGGMMSQYLDALEIGGMVDVKGPLGDIVYLGNGHFTVEGKHHFMKECAMLAGGTGITPMYQVIRAILNNPADLTRISLVFANRTEDDIMLRAELDKWAMEHSNFKVWYVVERPLDEGSWKYSTGFVNEEIVSQHLPPGSLETMAFMCGPPPMIQFACLPNLEKTGYNKSRCFQF